MSSSSAHRLPFPSLFRLRLIAIAAALAVLAVFIAHDAPSARAQTLSAPDTHLMQLMHLGFYLWWEESPGATGYDIQISSQSGSTWSQWSNVSHSGTAQPAIVTGLTEGTKYRWRIRATKSGMQSAWTTLIGDSRDTKTAISFDDVKPNPPILRSAVAGPGEVTVTWEPGPERSGVTIGAYFVGYRWENEQGEIVKGFTNAFSADTTTATVTGLTPGVQYEMWVKPRVWVLPIGDHTDGASSRILQATPQTGGTPTTSPGRCNLPGYTPPGLPEITIFTSTHNSITLHWNSPVYGTTNRGEVNWITNFLVWVDEAGVSDDSYGVVENPAAYWWEPATYQHTISGLSPSTTYLAQINARTITACYSGWSSVLVTTTAALNSGGWQLGVLPRPPQEEQSQLQQEQPNQAPTVAAALADVTIANQTGTHTVSLSRVFSDADNDDLAITAASSDEAVATVSVAADYSTLTVNARARGRTAITVTADDGNGGTVSGTFTVTVKAAPLVASALADMTGLAVGASRDVSLSGVFSDADGDNLTISASSNADAVATVSVGADRSSLTVEAVAEGTATITVAARDADGNQAIDEFEVTVNASTGSDIVARYDANADGAIDLSEWQKAVQDYVAKKITYSQLLEVVNAYMAS